MEARSCRPRVRVQGPGYVVYMVGTWPSLLSVWAAAWVRLASRPSLPPDRGSPLYIIIPTYYLPTYLPRYLTLASNAR